MICCVFNFSREARACPDILVADSNAIANFAKSAHAQSSVQLHRYKVPSLVCLFFQSSSLITLRCSGESYLAKVGLQQSIVTPPFLIPSADWTESILARFADSRQVSSTQPKFSICVLVSIFALFAIIQISKKSKFHSNIQACAHTYTTK
jgi:hypothetical protein